MAIETTAESLKFSTIETRRVAALMQAGISRETARKIISKADDSDKGLEKFLSDLIGE